MRRYALLTLFLTLWWSAVAAVYAEMLTPMISVARPGLHLGAALVANWLSWLLWVPVSLVCVAAVSRFPVGKGRLWPALATALACMLFAIFAKAVFVYVLNREVPLWYAETPTMHAIFQDSLRNNFILAGLMVGAAHGIHYARAHADGRVRIAELEASLARARLDTLSAQLNPHFLFNALNGIAETVHHNPQTADAMIVSLSSLLRQSLDRSGEHLIPLRDEIELLDHYLSLQRLRLGDRLATEIAVCPDCASAMTPRLLLQPLAENAIVHGVSRIPSGGRLLLDVRVDGGQLEIRLVSDGPLAADASNGAGIGLANVRQRLDTLFGDRATFAIDTVAGGRTQVVVTHPLIPGSAT